MGKLNHLILQLYGSAQECTSGEFQGHALGLIKPMLQFDSAALIGASFSADAEMSIQSIHIHNQPLEKLIERKDLVSPDTALAGAYRQRGRCLTMDMATLDRGHLDLIAYCKKYAVAQTMVLLSPPARSAHLDLIALWRAQPKKRYSARDERIGNLVLPHLFQARAINGRLFQERGAAEAAVALLSSQNGCLQYVEEAAVRILQREWPQWQPPILPAGFVDELRRPGPGRYLGKTFVARMDARGDYLHIQWTARPTGRALTGAEQDVAWLAASGLSYKEIARRQDVSPATVKNQLHSVFAKLGVANKTALAAALPRLTEVYPRKVHRTLVL